MSGKKEVSFIHIRPNTNTCKGGVTVAFEYDSETRLVTKAAFARCHETDNYNKKIGRIKARGRLNSDRLCVFIDEEITKKDFIADTLDNFPKLSGDGDPLYGYPPKHVE